MKLKKKNFEIKFYFFPTFRKIAVGGFVNQLIKKFWPNHLQLMCTPVSGCCCSVIFPMNGVVVVSGADCCPLMRLVMVHCEVLDIKEKIGLEKQFLVFLRVADLHRF